MSRGLAVLLGIPLIVAAYLGVCAVALIALWLVYLNLDSSASQPSQSSLRGTLSFGAVCLGGTLVALPLGVRLLRGKRGLVLFLRRFGFDDATKAVSYAAVNAIGRSWRLVTLDDERVQPVGGSSGRRKFTGFIALLMVAGVGYLVWWLLTHSVDDLVRGSNATGGNPYVAQIAAALAAGFFLVAVIFLATAMSVTALLVTTTYGFARRIEKTKTDRIRTELDVRNHSTAITKQSRRIFAPRLVVITVDNSVWHQAVQSLANSASAVIIDVSMPGESLRWEITTLLPVLSRRCVFVGSSDRIVEQGNDGRPVFSSPLAPDIDGHDVLAYRTDRAGMKRFSRALRATIEARHSEVRGKAMSS